VNSQDSKQIKDSLRQSLKGLDGLVVGLKSLEKDLRSRGDISEDEVDEAFSKMKELDIESQMNELKDKLDELKNRRNAGLS
jgi:hypothetical protein